MKLRIFGKLAEFDQLAIAVKNVSPFIAKLGNQWSFDTATCKSCIFEENWEDNRIELYYNYEQPREQFDFKELELIRLLEGRNWHHPDFAESNILNIVSPLGLFAPEVLSVFSKVPETFFLSHLGIHSTEQEASEWNDLFVDRGIIIAQENWSFEHTNPVIAGKRWYHDVIFDSRRALGFDMKITVRHDKKGAGYVGPSDT